MFRYPTISYLPNSLIEALLPRWYLRCHTNHLQDASHRLVLLGLVWRSRER